MRLLDDLIPGYECCDLLRCKPGYRRDIAADDICGCDDPGTAHWHVGPDKPVAGAGKE